MASKRVEKFAIRKRADAVIRDRRRIERFDDRLRGHHPSAENEAEFRRVRSSTRTDDTAEPWPWSPTWEQLRITDGCP